MMTNRGTASAPLTRTLKQASVGRLVCLSRHWTWADEALARFDRDLIDGWEQDTDPVADRPFGAYYHWCALLCSLGEAALNEGLLTEPQLEALQPELEATLPALRACRELLVTIPSSPEHHPHIVTLLRDAERLGQLRHLHAAFGEALREEHLSREFDSLDPDR
jgi:hypothetical protein